MVFDTVMEVLTTFDAKPKPRDGTADGPVYEIKGFVHGRSFVTFTVVINPTVSTTLSLVEVQRGRGDTFEYHELFRRFVEALGPLVDPEALKKLTQPGSFRLEENQNTTTNDANDAAASG